MLLLLELLDEVGGFLRRELAACLTLREPQRTARIAEVGVSGALQQLEELADLPSRRGRT
jgi:hypothetical protein